MDFYDDIASDYDRITGCGDRTPRAESFLRELRTRYPIASALDAACGTGLYAIQLAKMGVRTTGADLSQGMLDQARRRAQAAGVMVDWVPAPMQELASRLHERFDAVLCMGNSIPHLQTRAELDAAISGFVRLLNPGGIVVLQLLNYVRVLAKQERIVGITRNADREYVRFYDFLPDQVRFNILEISWKGDEATHQLRTTTLRPYRFETLTDALRKAGCQRIETCSNLEFAPFDADRSETVLLIGQKSE